MSGPVIAVSAQELGSSHRRVYAMNLAEIEQLSAELNRHQPVLMHTLVGFRLVFPEPRASGELALIGLVLWHAFRGFAALRERRIDDELYDRLADRNFAFLKYLDGERDPEEFGRLVDADLAAYRQLPAFAYLRGVIAENKGSDFRLSLEQSAKALLEMKGVLDSIDAVLNEGAGVDPEAPVPAHLRAPDPERLLSGIESAKDDTERFGIYLTALRNQLGLPCAATVLGKSVTVLDFLFDGTHRQGLVARLRKADGSEYTGSAYDVLLPRTSRGAIYLQAYRSWVDMAPAQAPAPARKNASPPAE